MVGEGLEEGKIGYASRVTETKYSTKEIDTRVRSTIYLLPFRKNHKGMND